MAAKSQSIHGNPANYNVTPATRSDTDASALEVDANGNLLVSNNTLMAGEDQTHNVLRVEGQFNYTHITDQANHSVKASPGFLHAVIVNTPLASGVYKVWDSLANSGLQVAVSTRPAVLLDDQPITVIYDIIMTVGIDIETQGANQDLTIVWR